MKLEHEDKRRKIDRGTVEQIRQMRRDKLALKKISEIVFEKTGVKLKLNTICNICLRKTWN